MRCRGIGGLALALALLVPGVHADDGWQPSSGNGGARLGCPVPVGVGASLACPVPVADPGVRPVSFDAGDPPLVIRAAAPDPSQPALTPPNPMFQWHRPGDTSVGGLQAVAALAGPDGAPLRPTPSDPVLTMPTPVPGGAGAPMGPTVTMDARPVPAWPMAETAITDGCVGGCPGELCGDCGCGCCPPGNRWYFGADYLLWWIRGQPLPPLVTTSNTPFSPNAGALGTPGTIVEYGGNSVNGGPYSGARFTVGYWLDPEHDLGFEASGFFLGARTATFQDYSNAQNLLARPFFNVDTGMPDREIKSAPGVVAGGVIIDARTVLWGAEANARSNLLCGENGYIDVLAGFRTLGLNESLNIYENVNIVAGPFTGVGFNILDQFRTSNQFYGGQIGAAGEYRIGRWSLDLTTKLALGGTQELVEIQGASTINNRGTLSTFPNNGILAQPSNDGRYSRDVFSVVPELGFSVGYNLTDHCRLAAGYNVLYWTSVVRPGNQIDLNVDPNQFATSNPTGAAPTSATRPSFSFTGSEFWAQGITVTLEFRY